jgi:hypothetical protein
VTLKIFLDEHGFHCLKRSIPAGSRSKAVVHAAFQVAAIGGSNTVIVCKEAEARNLLLYADHCPTVVTAIHDALRSAGLPVDKVASD